MTEPAAVIDAPGDAQIVHFVRETLGCGCPDEVFERIHVDTKPVVFGGLPVDYQIVIGGRLLVAVCARVDWRQARGVLADIVRAGRDYRDRNGYSRFRLVVATPETEQAVSSLRAVFDAAGAGDERLHLHVLAPSALPGAGSATIA